MGSTGWECLWCPLWEARSSSQPRDWPALPWGLSLGWHQVFPKSHVCRANWSLAPWPQHSPYPPRAVKTPPSQFFQDGLPARIPASRPDFLQLLCEWAGAGGGGLDSRPAYARMSWVVYFCLRSLVALGPGYILEVTGWMRLRWLCELWSPVPERVLCVETLGHKRQERSSCWLRPKRGS